MKLLYLQHVPFETPGYILDWAKEKNIECTCHKVYENTNFPELSTFDILVIMGGPMSVHDEDNCPWLENEKVFIKQCIDHQKYVLGICLGAQLIAEAVGANVFKNEKKEIGWMPVRVYTDHPVFEGFPEEIMVFHWHGDSFDHPITMVNLAHSVACRHQAFMHKDHVLGLQFHLEMTEEGVRNIVENCRNEIEEGGDFVQSEDEIIEGLDNLVQCNEYMHKLLDHFIS